MDLSFSFLTKKIVYSHIKIKIKRNLTLFTESASISRRTRAGSTHMVTEGSILTLALLDTVLPITAIYTL